MKQDVDCIQPIIFKLDSLIVAIATKRSSVPHVLICKDIHFFCKKQIRCKIYCKGNYPSLFLCKTKRQKKIKN